MATRKKSTGGDAYLHTRQPTTETSGLRWEEGRIVGVDTAAYLYLVESDSGDTYEDVRRIAESPASIGLLPLDARVMLCIGAPNGTYICGVVCYPRDDKGILLPYVRGQARYITAGDKILMGSRLNHVSIRDNGTCIVQSSPMAHIATYPNGHVAIHSNTFRHSSAFGEFGINQSGDAVSYYVRAGASQKNHTGPLVNDAWALRIDVGDTGNMLSVKVTTPENDLLSEFYMGSDGSIRWTSESDRFSRIYGDDTTKVSGTYTVHVEGNSSHVVEGTHTDDYRQYVFKCSAGLSQEIQGSRDIRVSGPDLLVVGGDQFHKVIGGSRQEITGAYERVITPTTSGVQVPQEATWINFGGGYNFFAGPGTGGFNVVTGATPYAVNLAVDGVASYESATGQYLTSSRTGGHKAVLGDELVSWLKSLVSWLDSHTHGTAVGPSTPPVLLASVDPGVQSKPVDAYFLSQRVTLGG